jgi:hypothetical protein
MNKLLDRERGSSAAGAYGAFGEYEAGSIDGYPELESEYSHYSGPAREFGELRRVPRATARLRQSIQKHKYAITELNKAILAMEKHVAVINRAFHFTFPAGNIVEAPVGSAFIMDYSLSCTRQ